jgi:hypothetical protein
MTILTILQLKPQNEYSMWDGLIYIYCQYCTSISKKIELANIVIIRVPQCSISIRVPQYPVGYNNMAD